MPEYQPRLVIADDHRLLREGLRRALNANGFTVVGEASDGEHAITLAEKHHPDVILMDVTMPNLDGIQATRRLVAEHPGSRVVMLTMHEDADVKARAVAAGAKGFLVKDCSTRDIVHAIHAVLEGNRGFVDGTEFSPLLPRDHETTEKPPITKREVEVLQLIADGKTTAQVASELYVSQKTIKNHLASIYAKLDAHDRTQAVLRGARLGIVHIVE